jgi:hypothetical protein
MEWIPYRSRAARLLRAVGWDEEWTGEKTSKKRGAIFTKPATLRQQIAALLISKSPKDPAMTNPLP